MRVIISSQGMGHGSGTIFYSRDQGIERISVEPTVVPPVLLDLCSVAFMHRFSSQCWWDHISKHFSADLSSAFDEIVRLKVCSILEWSSQRLDRERKSCLDRPSDRVGAVGPRDVAQA